MEAKSLGIIFVGAPGSGKGTVTEFLEGLGFVSISSSAEMRRMERENAHFRKCHPVSRVMATHGLCCNKALFWALEDAFRRLDHPMIVLDGAVRLGTQVEPVVDALRKKVEDVKVIHFKCSRDTCLKRIAGRLKKKQIESPDKVREEDYPEVALDRQKLYEETLPGIFAGIRREGVPITTIDAEKTPEIIQAQLRYFLGLHCQELRLVSS